MELLLKSSHVYMKDPDIVHRKLAKIQEDGVEKLIFISDFDHTLSKYKDEDENIGATTPQILRYIVLDKCPEMKSTYDEMVTKFKAIETCPLMTTEEKVPYMEEWWSKSLEYALRTGISKQDFVEKVTTAKLSLRDRTEEYLKMIAEEKVPHIIFSAGLGDVIEVAFTKFLGKPLEKLHIVSNMMEFDNKDVCVAFSKPLIHSFNKNSSVLTENHLFLEDIKDRTNVILMGDSLGDPHMDVGIKEEGAALKIGFLNFGFDTHMEKYQSLYDIVIKDDQTMNIPMKIFEDIVNHLEN